MTQETKVTQELKPCPFCGGEAEMDTMQGYLILHSGELDNRSTIYCLDCDAEMGFCHADLDSWQIEAAIKNLITAWNTRASTEAADALLREARAELNAADLGFGLPDASDLIDRIDTHLAGASHEQG